MTKFVERRNLKAIQLDLAEPADGELTAAAEHIVRELLEGVGHGFFKMTVAVERVQAGKTSITVEAGKSTRFVV